MKKKVAIVAGSAVAICVIVAAILLMHPAYHSPIEGKWRMQGKDGYFDFQAGGVLVWDEHGGASRWQWEDLGSGHLRLTNGAGHSFDAYYRIDGDYLYLEIIWDAQHHSSYDCIRV